MKPDMKSPYFYLFILFSIAIFAQAVILGAMWRSQIIDNSSSGSPALLGICLGLLFTGLAALSYFKTTSYTQSMKNQILVSVVIPLVLLPIIAFVIISIILLPIYDLV